MYAYIICLVYKMMIDGDWYEWLQYSRYVWRFEYRYFFTYTKGVWFWFHWIYRKWKRIQFSMQHYLRKLNLWFLRIWPYPQFFSYVHLMWFLLHYSQDLIQLHFGSTVTAKKDIKSYWRNLRRNLQMQFVEWSVDIYMLIENSIMHH